ncbi:DnaJ domain-containing protein [Coniochaeta sp. 2T2.1]|nr:DnaJ domain-containing protein [Coniochaeta sp. 2T2.1]
MPSFEDITDGEPPTIDPYEVLAIERTATADQVKSAYRKAALKNHPDKVSEDKKTEAHEKFQQIAFAYAILSDPLRRKRYDETGSTSESIVDSEGFSWSDYYREQFRDAINDDAIDKFAKQYKGSDEEKDDLLAAYEKYRGSMDGVYESVMCSNVLDDDERFRAIIDEAIAKGDVKSYKLYANESQAKRDRRVKRAKEEAGEAEEYAKELGVHDKLFGKKKKTKKDSEADLAALIRQRQDSRGSFLDNLAEKYGAAPKAKKGKKRVLDEEEPDEEAFQAAAARLNKPKEKQKVKRYKMC